MVIIISLSFGERRDDERMVMPLDLSARIPHPWAEQGVQGTAPSSTALWRKSIHPTPQGGGTATPWMRSQDPSREFPCNSDDIVQEMKRQIPTLSYLKRSDNCIASLIQHCDLLLKPSCCIELSIIISTECTLMEIWGSKLLLSDH